jgi:hypothetical protein
MSHGRELKSPGAMALRAAGYKPCPRWWLTGEQMELVAYMASQNSAEVNRIRAGAVMSDEERKAAELEAAWEKQKEWNEK